MAEQSEAFVKRVHATRLPGLTQTGQGHTGVGVLRAARATADRTDYHQWANTSLHQIVVGAAPIHEHNLAPFVVVAQQARTQCLTRKLVGTSTL